MRVYRCITAREITSIYKDINDYMAIVKGENTHNYEKGKNYIHFFRYSQSAEYFFNKTRFSMSNLDLPVLYMVANIPYDILKQYSGYGFYSYEQFNNDIIPLPEYAIPTELFKKEYIVELNNLISYQYKSDDNEYNKYLQLLQTLIDKYDGNFYAVAKYLNLSSLESRLNIQIDDRTEEKIFNDKIKTFQKVWKGYD